jgi:hypothetical protein
VALLGSCLTPIERNSDYIGGQLVISGQISPLEEQNIITLGRTAFSVRLPEPVSGATITLMDDQGNESFYLEDPEVAGTYRLPSVTGIPGRTYHIRVTLSGGEIYESVPEKLPVAIGEDVVYHVMESVPYTDLDGIVAERNFINIYTTAALPAEADALYLKWHVDEVYILSPTDFPDPFGNVPPSCFISQQVDPQRVILYNGETSRATSIPDMLVSSRIVDKSFKERHYFTTYQSSLTREAYEYWRKVDVVANQVGSIFDAPPARVEGNIFNVNRNEEVLGYFQAVNQNYKRFFLLPADFPFRMTEHCEYRPEREYRTYPTECLNCLSARNSSYNRPPWF